MRLYGEWLRAYRLYDEGNFDIFSPRRLNELSEFSGLMATEMLLATFCRSWITMVQQIEVLFSRFLVTRTTWPKMIFYIGGRSLFLMNKQKLSTVEGSVCGKWIVMFYCLLCDSPIQNKMWDLTELVPSLARTRCSKLVQYPLLIQLRYLDVQRCDIQAPSGRRLRV